METKDENQNFSYVGDSLNNSNNSLTKSFNTNTNQFPPIDISKYNVTSSGQVLKNSTNNTSQKK